MAKPLAREKLISATVRFAGDSGDGMQLTGTQFSTTSANLGNDISTFPDFPAEIRAPAGTVPGVSGFQVHFSSTDIHTPGDVPNALVAMNPAALKANVGDLQEGGLIIINENAFNKSNLKKAEYERNPLEDDSLSHFRVVSVPITEMTLAAVEPSGLNKKDAERCKNFFALGVVYYLFDRTPQVTERWIDDKFSKRPDLAEANKLALRAGYSYADTAEIFTSAFDVPSASLPKGTYRSITGNQASAMGFVAAAQLSGIDLFYGSYPITPASDVLHELAKLRHFGVQTFQAEDEIAAVCAAIGAAYGGKLALTGTSGPGVCLKSEAINLAIMTELPLVILDVQRAGPSTGLPTKTEQSDLLQAMYGRNGDSPIVVLAPATPSECFYYAIESFRIATEFMTPVMLLSDGYLANGAEPWKIPDPEELPKFHVHPVTEAADYRPYARNADTLARDWALPGTKGLEHRLGGLEKEDLSGNVSYDPENHQKMTNLRYGKIDAVAKTIPDLEVFGDASAKTLVLGWGGTYGAIFSAIEKLNGQGRPVAGAHFRYLNPFPANTKRVLDAYDTVIVPELNTGQLNLLLRAKFDNHFVPFNKVKGRPFLISELMSFIGEYL